MSTANTGGGDTLDGFIYDWSLDNGLFWSVCLNQLVLSVSERIGGNKMWLLGVGIILLFAYLGHALLYPEKY